MSEPRYPDYPCCHGHYNCATRDGGACSDERRHQRASLLAPRLESLLMDGFDRSHVEYDDDDAPFIDVECSQCDALCVNGTPCHETGCPNTVFECRGCNARMARAGSYCRACGGGSDDDANADDFDHDYSTTGTTRTIG
jgi:hypothetical protein